MTYADLHRVLEDHGYIYCGIDSGNVDFSVFMWYHRNRGERLYVPWTSLPQVDLSAYYDHVAREVRA